MYQIACDSPARAKKFNKDLITRIRQIPLNPWQYRKSIYFDDIEIRDLIFKGYTIVFRVTEQLLKYLVL